MYSLPLTHFDSMVTPGNPDKNHRDSEDNGEIIIEDEDECEKDYVEIIKDDNDESEVEKIDEDIVFVDKYQSESKQIYEEIVIEDDYKSDSKQNYEDTYNEDVNIVENIDIDIDFTIQNRYSQNSSPRTTYN